MVPTNQVLAPAGRQVLVAGRPTDVGLSPDGRWFMFTSSRGFGNEPLAAPLDFDHLQRRLHAPGNGLRDIYVVDAQVLKGTP